MPVLALGRPTESTLTGGGTLGSLTWRGNYNAKVLSSAFGPALTAVFFTTVAERASQGDGFIFTAQVAFTFASAVVWPGTLDISFVPYRFGTVPGDTDVSSVLNLSSISAAMRSETYGLEPDELSVADWRAFHQAYVVTLAAPGLALYVERDLAPVQIIGFGSGVLPVNRRRR